MGIKVFVEGAAECRFCVLKQLWQPQIDAALLLVKELVVVFLQQQMPILQILTWLDLSWRYKKRIFMRKKQHLS
jgi:hypothetical protein